MNLSYELKVAVALAREAGSVVMSYHNKENPVEWKAPGDPVTAADRAASRCIMEKLEHVFPDDGILCEEEVDNPRRFDRSRVWFVDPLDGTKQFLAQGEEFAVMIGLTIEGVPSLGVIFQPSRNKLFYAAHGGGAFLQEQAGERALQTAKTSSPDGAVLVGSRSRPSAAAERIRTELGVRHTMQYGSFGLKVGLICEAKADIYVQEGTTSLWDACGPEAILREAGGTLTDLRGNPLNYNSNEVHLHGVLASNGPMHDRLVAALR